MLQDELEKILKSHELWTRDAPRGQKADLSGLDMSGLDLSGAELIDADMSGAILSGAILKGADLRGAILGGAILKGADLGGAKLKGADFSGADLSGAKFDPDLAIPIVERIDERILAAIQQEGASLKMDAWHTCETAHCRAGWAIVLAGEAGKALQEKVGPCAAAALIYAVSRPNKRVPDFYARNGKAMDSIRRDAEEAQKERV